MQCNICRYCKLIQLWARLVYTRMDSHIETTTTILILFVIIIVIIGSRIQITAIEVVKAFFCWFASVGGRILFIEICIYRIKFNSITSLVLLVPLLTQLNHLLMWCYLNYMYVYVDCNLITLWNTHKLTLSLANLININVEIWNKLTLLIPHDFIVDQSINHSVFSPCLTLSCKWPPLLIYPVGCGCTLII